MLVYSPEEIVDSVSTLASTIPVDSQTIRIADAVGGFVGAALGGALVAIIVVLLVQRARLSMKRMKAGRKLLNNSIMLYRCHVDTSRFLI